MSQLDEIVVRLAGEVQTLQTEVADLRSALSSLQTGLINAFREQGFDFSKIGQIAPSRTPLNVIAEINAEANPEFDSDGFDPDIQDEIARKILNPRAEVDKASNKGRKE